MPFNDLRDWLDHLRAAGELLEVDAEVDPHLEITEITDRTVKAGGPALYFRNVKGSQLPVVINQFGTRRRACMAFGVDDLDELGERVSEVLEMAPPEGMMDKLRMLASWRAGRPRPKSVTSGALPGGRRDRPASTRCRSSPPGPTTAARTSRCRW